MMTERIPRLAAVRGATTVGRDTPEEVVAATTELLERIMGDNSVASGDIVSIVFTSTPDLTSEFPAVAARRLGLTEVPLLCAAEISVPGALPRCIRVLMHVYLAAPERVRHAYLRGASELRTDLR